MKKVFCFLVIIEKYNKEKHISSIEKFLSCSTIKEAKSFYISEKRKDFEDHTVSRRTYKPLSIFSQIKEEQMEQYALQCLRTPSACIS